MRTRGTSVAKTLGLLASRTRSHAGITLDIAGLACLSIAAGMWHLAAGVAAVGVSCLIIGALTDRS